jgi:hypothetical protein
VLEPGIHVHSYIETALRIFLESDLCMYVCKFICIAHLLWKHAPNDAESAVIG